MERSHVLDRATPEGIPIATIANGVGGPESNSVHLSEENHRRHAHKLEAVGHLANGVAHDFNNLLTVILGHCESLQAHEAMSGTVRESLEEITIAAARAADLTRQLLTFSRPQPFAPQMVDVNAIIVQSERLLRRLIGENIELRVQLADDLKCVRLDAGQLEQVIVNLVVNARDAMTTGGSISIRTQNALLRGPSARKNFGLNGRYAVLVVSDTGSGMDGPTQQRMFEPYFTTKDRGKGTGLGLSTVQSIVQQSGGHILVQSEPGRGTTFRIYFPARAGIAHVQATSVVSADAAGGDETILLVEDEEQVRTVMANVLRRHGYSVLESRTPAEAIELSRQCKSTIHLLLTDVVMPHISGRSLAEKLSLQRPDMNVLYVSGYEDYTLSQHGMLAPGVALLRKPLMPATLLSKVREILDDRRAAGAARVSL